MTAVPCGRCTACCRYELIPVTAEDDVASYETEFVHGVRALKRKADGSCVYLGKRGCRIHSRAPTICKTFDCRLFAKTWLENPQSYTFRYAPSDSEVIKAGLERLSTL